MKIRIEDDFDPGKIIRSGQCFRAGWVEPGVISFMTGRKVLELRDLGGGAFRADCTPKEWDAVWRPYFDLDTDYAAVRAGLPRGFLSAAAEEGRGIRILRQDPWETLVSFIISQRKSIPAIRGAVETLARLYGRPMKTKRGTVYAFPTPREMKKGLSDFGGCPLGYRLPYVRDAVERAVSGETDLQALASLSDADLLRELMKVKGVGVKVAGCTALFAFGRKAVAPVDTWISKIMESEYGGRNPFPECGKNAGIAQQYAFFYAQNHKERYAK